MGVAAGGATLEIQLVADVARLQRDMAEMRQAVKSATGSAAADFTQVAAASGTAATQMAAAAQASARAAVGAGAGVRTLGAGSQMAAHHLQNLTFQLNDVVVGLASGQKPMTVFMQQGLQIAQIMQQAGGGVRAFVSSALQMLGIIKVTGDAVATAAAAEAAANAAALKTQADRAAASVAFRQTQVALARAELATAASADAQAAAQTNLVRTLRAVEIASGKSAVAQQALAVAQAEAATTAQASAAKQVVGIGRVGVIAGSTAIVLGVLAAAFGGVKAQAEGSDAELKKYIASLGLTDKEVKKLKDTHVTFGDVAKATFQVLGEQIGLSADDIKNAWGKALKWITDFGRFSVSVILAAFAALVQGIVSLFTNLPGIVGNIIIGVTNFIIQAIEKLINMGIQGINNLIDKANVFGLGIAQLSTVSLGRIEKEFSGTFGNIGRDIKGRFYGTYQDVQGGFDRIAGLADGFRKARIKGQADEMIGDRNAAKAKKEKQKATEDVLGAMDRETAGMWRLVEAYKQGDAASMRMEARLKAEKTALEKKLDVEKVYAAELAQAVAQRAVEGAKDLNNIRNEIALRTQINNRVAEGTLTAKEATNQLALEQKLRPLIAAAANAEGDAKQRLLEIIQGLTQGTAELNAQVAREAALRETTKNNDEVEKLRLEAQLLGASNRERATRMAQLEAERFIRDNNVAPEDRFGVEKSYQDAANAATDLEEAQAAYNIELGHSLEMLNLLSESTQNLANVLSSAFGTFGDTIGNILVGLTNWQAKEQEIADWKAEQLKTVAAGSQAAADIEAQAAKKSGNAQMQAIAGTLSAAKGLFKEKSAGYKILTALEKAYAVLQIVNTVKAIAMDATQTASSVANSTARATADTAAGGAKIFSQLGAWAFPVVAAMVGVMAALMGGKGGGGSVSIPAGLSAEDVQAAQGAGTVLGDSGAKSQSIANSLEIMAKNSTRALDYSGEMVTALRSIRDNIGVLAAAVARNLSLSGGFFDQSRMGLGTSGKKGFLGLFGGSSTTKSLIDQGFNINDAMLGAILGGNGISGYSYNVIQKIKTKSGFLGIGGGTKTSYSTTKGALPDEVDKLFTDVISSLYDTVVASAKVLGLDVSETLKNFKVEIGKISLQGLKGDEITQALESIFSRLGDQMAGFAVAGLENFQKVGEGLFETLNRLAMDYMTIDAALRSIGTTFGAVGASSIEARENLLELSGGLDEFVNQVNYFYDHFLSDEDKQGFMRAELTNAFAKAGVAVPTTIDAFKDLVLAQDLTTEAGRKLYAVMMAVAPAFYELETAEEKAAEAAAKAAEAAAKAADQLERQRMQLQIQLLEAQGRAVEALALRRQMELAALDESLRGLQQEVWLAQDVAAAKKDLLDAYKREAQVLTSTADRFRRFASDLRDFRDSLFETGAATSYNQALAKLMAQGGLAAAGDEGALGGGLKDAASSFLEIATANAQSMVDIARARALVASYVDQGIMGADNQVSMAEQQLAELQSQVSALVSIDEHVLTVAEAIEKLNSLLSTTIAPTSSNLVAEAPAMVEEVRALKNEVTEKLETLQTATETGVVSMNKVAKVLSAADRGGALAVYTDPDSPLNTVASA